MVEQVYVLEMLVHVCPLDALGIRIGEQFRKSCPLEPLTGFDFQHSVRLLQ